MKRDLGKLKNENVEIENRIKALNKSKQAKEREANEKRKTLSRKENERQRLEQKVLGKFS